MGLVTVGDLVEHFPFRHEVEPPPQAIDTLVLDEPATVIAEVQSVRLSGPMRRLGVRAMLRDATGRMSAVWFNAPHMADRLRPGGRVRLFGKVTEHNQLAEMVNPRVQWLDGDGPGPPSAARLIAVYPATGQLPSRQIAAIVQAALREADAAIVETLPPELLARRGLLGRREAVLCMHHPPSLEAVPEARRRLAYEELLLMQLAIALGRRWTATHARAPILAGSPRIDERIRRRFPFRLTDAQNRVIAEIAADLARERPMTRLLQGDVGSGKTVVALYAALLAVANRRQCAILAPTEVLAAQHFNGINRYLEGSRVRRCLLGGRGPRTGRARLLESIADEAMDLVVGTQALLEEKVRFGALGLVIVDEQHKFGVAQRATLRSKPKASADSPARFVPHYLVMTATPIPRTLSMTVFGDLDVSVIDELPPGRSRVATALVRPPDEARAWLEVRRRIARGEQAYIVYPLVEESEAVDLKAAVQEAQQIGRTLLPGAAVGLLHGRMKNPEKQEVMSRFAAGRLDVLVTTTVIEVGVDVPNATVMVVQHAERYGLSALHQLRGRVGRGSKPGLCLLFARGGGEAAARRLDVLCRTCDGFRIAEEDLRIRGPGELLGTRQHGWPEFRVASLIEDVELLTAARDDAARLVAADPRLAAPEHAALRAELRRRFREKVAFIDVA